MAGNPNFRTFYKADYTSQGTLINEIFPREVAEIVASIKLLENRDKESIKHTIAWFAANIPPYKKYFKDYISIMEKLSECCKLRDEWITKNQCTGYPIDLKNKLYHLYEKWWEAYNDSGAGIRGTVFDPQEKRRVYDALTGKPDNKAKTFYANLPRLSV